MPEKKATKPAAKATATKKAPARTKRQTSAKGDSYACEVCGLVVTVDEDCGCIEEHDIICCGEPMKPRKTAKVKVK